LIVVTNIDNFLRPILVPRAARLDSALMLLAVFAGIAMFGAWGIVIGPVLMIVIVTTISVYLAVYKGVPMASPADDDEKPKRPNLFGRLAGRLKRARAKTKAPKKAPPAKSAAT
jgi:AI-2E family transporter